MPPFRFELGQRVRVVTHPARPVGVITARWTAEEMADVHGENVYAVSVFVTKQRESSLEFLGSGRNAPSPPPAPPQRGAIPGSDRAAKWTAGSCRWR